MTCACRKRSRLVQLPTSGVNTVSLLNLSMFSPNVKIYLLTLSDTTRSLFTKEQEFRAWLVEERKINPETVTKDQTKKEFARFVEDYNTGPSSPDVPAFLSPP